MPSPKIARSIPGAPSSKTLLGPPERITPFGARARISSALIVNGTISE